MPDNSRKTPLAFTLHRFAERKDADWWWREGKAAPCQVTSVAGQIVTVSFQVNGLTLPQVTMPIATWIYDWIPVRAGDAGFAISADFYIGGVSGLGGGTAGSSQLGNLTNLVFVPVANAAWTAPGDDAAMRVVQGPDGVLIQDLTGTVVGNFSKTNGITLSFGGHSVIINSTGVIIDGKVFLTHEHTEVQRGGDNTGPVA